MELATSARMKPAKNIQELVVWQLACRLSEAIDEMVASPAAKRHRTLCNQISRSGSSVAANLAEGFGRFHPSENAGFVRIAKASLTETQNHLLKGNSRGCWRADDFTKAWRLSCRATKAIVPYLLYLESCKKDPGSN
jgi:four helix bundle protein